MLRNDHVEATGKVERAMAELHASAGVQAGVARVTIVDHHDDDASAASPSEPKRPRVDAGGDVHVSLDHSMLDWYRRGASTELRCMRVVYTSRHWWSGICEQNESIRLRLCQSLLDDGP